MDTYVHTLAYIGPEKQKKGEKLDPVVVEVRDQASGEAIPGLMTYPDDNRPVFNLMVNLDSKFEKIDLSEYLKDYCKRFKRAEVSADRMKHADYLDTTWVDYLVGKFSAMEFYVIPEEEGGIFEVLLGVRSRLSENGRNTTWLRRIMLKKPKRKTKSAGRGGAPVGRRWSLLQGGLPELTGAIAADGGQNSGNGGEGSLEVEEVSVRQGIGAGPASPLMMNLGPVPPPNVAPPESARASEEFDQQSEASGLSAEAF